MTKASQAIGIFDSGMGGLTVMRAISLKLPHEKIVYFGDTANLPYGDKTPEDIANFSLASAHFLLQQQIKLLVVACNTASSYALHKLQNYLQIPIVEVIEPGAMKALEVSKNNYIAVLGTQATISSKAHLLKIQQLNPNATVHLIACPLLASIVEEGMQEHLSTKLILDEYLNDIHKEVDTILLGCTHYPVLTELIQQKMGQNIQIVDSALSCAEKVAEILYKNQLLNEQKTPDQYFVSDNPEKFRLLGPKILGSEIPEVSLATPFLQNR